jgi:hypothetical protein
MILGLNNNNNNNNKNYYKIIIKPLKPILINFNGKGNELI